MTNFPRGNGLSQQLLAVTKRGNCCHFRQLETERSNQHPMRPGRTTPHHTRRWTQELSYWLPITLPREFFFLRRRLPSNMEPLIQSVGRQWAIHGSRTFSQVGCSHASLSEMLDGHGHHNGCGCYHMTVVRDSRSHFFSESLDHSVWIISE